jgi:hypothetical protein
MKKIIILAVIVLFLSGCAPGTKPSAPQCTLGNELKCTGIDYDGSGFVLSLQNTRTAEITDITINIEKCEGEGFAGNIAAEGTKSVGVECSNAKGSFESSLIANYEILGTKYLRVGKITADMDYFE